MVFTFFFPNAEHRTSSTRFLTTEMKPSTVLGLFGYTLVTVADLLPRQERCSEDECYRAVWGTVSGTARLDHPLTAQRDCMSRLTTTVAFYPV